ncbi:LPS translocon maturation chaperone LptM [Microvirga sp. 2TAF3]|uniref:LPS translocon maturation chaperone LptM n=1 Tax=Microvirga sp. 2TAF3 TaxID=3233014 RepID=UPI003F9AD1A0
MSSSLSFSRIALIAGVLALGLSACGRRGALEPPPDPSAPQQQSANPTGSQGVIASPIGTPSSKNAHRGYTIPKEPFILDPLL